MPASLRSRAPWILAALAAPWLAYGCDVAPLGPGVTGTTTGTGTGGVAATVSSSSSTSSSTSTSSSSSTSSTSSSSGTGGAPVTADGGDAGEDALACETAVVAFPVVASPHIYDCSPVAYTSNPPTSGPHYYEWAAYKTYSVPVERIFYVHDLEHGGIVILYNCPSGCDEDLAQLSSFLDARPADPTCTAPVKSRIVVTPDPLIPTKFAAAAWGWALTSQCFDFPALGSFIDAHYGMGSEDLCTDGIDVTAADAGLPDGCGQPITDGG